MFVVTPISALPSGFYSYPSIPISPYRTQLEITAQQAAYECAMAHARTEALLREQIQRRLLVEDELREQALRDAIYRQQVADAMRRTPRFGDAHSPAVAQYSLQDFLDYQLMQERERKRIASERQREFEYARAIAYPLEQVAAQRSLPVNHRGDDRTSLAFMLAGYPTDQMPVQSGHPSRMAAKSVAPQRQAGISRHPYTPRSLWESFLERLDRESDPEVSDTLQNLLSQFGAPVPQPPPTPADTKGKAKATNVEPPVHTADTAGPSLLDVLASRKQVEEDPDVQGSLETLMRDLLGLPGLSGGRRDPTPVPSFVDVKGKGKEKEVRFDVPSAPSTSKIPSAPAIPIPSDALPKPTPQQKPEEPTLHRTPSLPPALAARVLSFYRSRRARRISLIEIKEIEDTLRALEASFVLPTQLDFTPPASPAASDAGSVHDLGAENGLAYTMNNSPVLSYEHALNGLLTRLDAVESGGDLEVRGRRKEVVCQVEQALQDVGRRVEESRERSRERAQAPRDPSSMPEVLAETAAGPSRRESVAEGRSDPIPPAVVGAVEASAPSGSSPRVASASAPSEAVDNVALQPVPPITPVLRETSENDAVDESLAPFSPVAEGFAMDTSTVTENAPADDAVPRLSPTDTAARAVGPILAPSEGVMTAPDVQPASHLDHYCAEPSVRPLDNTPSSPATPFSPSPSSPSPASDAASDALASSARADHQSHKAHLPSVDEDAYVVTDGVSPDEESDTFMLSLSPAVPSVAGSLAEDDAEMVQRHDAVSDGGWSEVEA